MRAAPITACAAFVGIALAILTLGAFGGAATRARSDAKERGAAAVFTDLVAAHGTGLESSCETLLDTLSHHTRAELRALVERAAEPGRTDDVAGAALRVLRRFGTREDVSIVAALYREDAKAALESTLVAIGKRDPRTLDTLAILLQAVSPEVRASFVRAVESIGSPDAATWLARCAERASDVRCEALARLGRLAESLPNPVPDEAFAVVRNVLGGIESDALRDAVIAAGRMEDGDSIPHLIALLSEEDAGLRIDAAWSLGRITGLKLRERRERWEDWYETELAWWRDDSDRAFAALQETDPAARTRALLEISSRKSSRDRLAMRVVPLLEHDDAATAKLAAWTLRVLRAKCAVAPLIQALERSEPEVRVEAWRALRGITRKDLPESAADWRAVCAG